ncbi:unnamed protein product [Nippostrongylus brasiliensis]|uniref:Uncharacterized protein n=1 Tax=Nippostrongylus brasiliensis TaxID=27835 RepID=A0A0N4XGC7_NIPBR|nr:unnamed protein product [Nippostrongylus brasiliensis]
MAAMRHFSRVSSKEIGIVELEGWIWFCIKITYVLYDPLQGGLFITSNQRIRTVAECLQPPLIGKGEPTGYVDSNYSGALRTANDLLASSCSSIVIVALRRCSLIYRLPSSTASLILTSNDRPASRRSTCTNDGDGSLYI